MKNLLALLLILVLVYSCIQSDDENVNGFNWEISEPGQLGLNNSLLESGVIEAENVGSINSLIVIKDNKIVLEKYFNGFSVNSYQTVRSVSKSFLSALVGIAISKGMMDLDQKLLNSFPEYNSSVSDTNFNMMTLRHLITMKSGVSGDQEFYMTFTQSSNWIRTILQSQLKFIPGTKTLYSTAGTHLISGMLTKSTIQNSMAFAEQFLFKPSGIYITDWVKDPQGIYFGGNDMIFTTRNMAVLGLLYLNKGKLNNTQIVPEDWINYSLQYSGNSNITWGALTEGGYGAGWWLGKVSGKKVFFALGHGGQFIMCIPEYDMIAAITSDPYTDWETADFNERQALQLIADYIIPSVN